MKNKTINIFYILAPLYCLIDCVLAGLWFIEYDRNNHFVPITLGLITCFNFILSLIFIKFYYKLKFGDDRSNRLGIFNFINIFNIFPIVNLVVFLLTLIFLCYHAIKYYINKNNVKITY